METGEQKNQSRHGTANFEKREHPRFSVDLPVEYYKLGSPVKHVGKAMNASQGGLLLYFSEPLKIGQYLRLKLFLSSRSTLSAIETITEVAWTDIHLDEGLGEHRTGVKFFDTSSENMSKLKNFLLSLPH
jgi:c-di-GMP-binding flagellar brake protein YcgR